MLILKSGNLGKRQQELNEEVSKTTSKNVDFNLIKDLEEQSDVDRLYKIEVASVYKNIDYIIETLKCGDSLYISRALKCSWLYESDSSSIINPDYLHHEIFPYMSIKMKKKMLTSISMHVKDNKRSEDFYKYCLTDKKFNNIAGKFLIWTSEQYKMEFITKNDNISKIKNFIGNSFNLAQAYLAKEKTKNKNTNKLVHEFRYLMKISNEKYLDLMEIYTEHKEEGYFRPEIPKLGLRLSKYIITKHKERISNNVKLYFRKLHMSIIAKHSSIEDVKVYAVALLPSAACEFWRMNFYESYKKIFKTLPQDEVFIFLRQIFLSNYPNEPFEMSEHFYFLKYYELLPYKEREQWALENLRQNNELLGPDRDYLWYQFVNYDLAFEEIKKYVLMCTDHNKRADMVNILILSVTNEQELEKLLRYFYDRHINESEDFKMSFINKVADKNNILKFDENCWDAFNKILYSTKIYSFEYNFPHASRKYKTITILYHIIHDKEIPTVLQNYVTTRSNASNIENYKRTLYNSVTDEQINLVYQKLIDLSTKKLTHLDTEIYDIIKEDAREIVYFVLSIVKTFEKTINDCPEIILKYMKLDSTYYENNYFFLNKGETRVINDGELLRLLKQDSKLLVQNFPDLLQSFSGRTTRNVIKKIKIYFSNDVGKDLLCYCESLLKNTEFGYKNELLYSIVFAIFHIASADYKITFVSNYVPQESKIAHDTIDRKLLTIQEGICRFALYSRPPLPLQCILPYIQGDYMHYCLPMFGSYLNKLPVPQCIKFITAILKTPVSIQKHALRLAFECFSLEDLINLINEVWNSTKNVSLRMTIYTALFQKIHDVDQNSQKQLYEVLKILTLDLGENDDAEVFTLLTDFVLPQYEGDFLKIAWNTVQKLTDKNLKNIERKLKIVNKIESRFTIIDKEFCRTEILDKFVRLMLTDKNIGNFSKKDDMNMLIDSKWKLAAKYIIHIDNDQMENSLELLKFILHRCIEMWHIIDKGIYASRKFLFWFVDKMLFYSTSQENKTDCIPIFEYILKLLCELLPMTQIYMLCVKLNLIIISKKVIGPNEGNYVHLVPENIAKDLTTEVIILLNDLKAKNMLFPSFINEIGSLLREVMRCMFYYTKLKCDDNFAILISSRFIETNLPEAHFLALSVLPRHVDNNNYVISKIQKGDNLELKAYVYEHFVYQKFK